MILALFLLINGMIAEDLLDGEMTTCCEVEKGCFMYPTDCAKPSNCTYTLRWRHQEDPTIVKIKITGKPANFDMLNQENLWLAFGLSRYGTMDNSNIFLCLRHEEKYSAIKSKGYSHGLSRSTQMSVSEGAVNGSYVDGLLSCAYYVNTTNFPSVGMRLFYGIGPLDSEGIPKQHHRTPTTTLHEVNLTTDLSAQDDFKCTKLKDHDLDQSARSTSIWLNFFLLPLWFFILNCRDWLAIYW